MNIKALFTKPNIFGTPVSAMYAPPPPPPIQSPETPRND